MKKLGKILIAVVLAAAVLTGAGYGACMAMTYPAQEAAAASLAGSTLEGSTYFWSPEGADTGIIFYPGALVSIDAYAPLMAAISDKGIACALVKMPGNLAIFGVNAADKVVPNHPEIQNWYLMGHSMGGAMAGSYLAGRDGFAGLIFLGAYTTGDLTEKDLKILSIFGENDLVLNREKYERTLSNLPQAPETLVIEGGNHAGFALYGPQRDDGEADITKEEQITITAEKVAEFVLK